MFKIAVAVLATVLLASGCGGTVRPEVPSGSPTTKADTGNVTIDGDPSTPVNQLAIEAIADLQAFWADRFPYGEDYEPVEGGLYASTPESESGPACASN